MVRLTFTAGQPMHMTKVLASVVRGVDGFVPSAKGDVIRG